MAMPKKGRRKITVDGKAYYYTIKPMVYGGPDANGGRLTVQLAEGEYMSKLIEGSITPKIVEEFIISNM